MEAVKRGGIRPASGGLSDATIVYRCGYVMMKFGEWLMLRDDPIPRHPVQRQQEWVRNDSRFDIDALTEMTLKEEVGAPFPPVDPN